MKYRNGKKILSILLTLLLTLSLLPANALAAETGDISGHWAAEAIEKCQTYGIMSGEDASVVNGAPELSCSYAQGDPAGNYNIVIVQGTLATDNYDFTFVNGTLSVGLANQSPLSIDAPGAKTYGDAAFNLSVTGGSGTDAVGYAVVTGTDVISISGSTVTIHKAGSATVTATKAGDADYNPVTSGAVTIAADKRDLSNATVTVSGTYTYDGTAQTPTPSVNDSGATITASDYNVTHSNNVNAGTATVIITATAGGNYTRTQTGSFTINKATPSYTVPTDLTATYGQTLADITLPLGFTWEVAATTPVGSVGNNPFTVTYSPVDTDNYNIVTGINVTIMVNKAADAAVGTPTVSGSPASDSIMVNAVTAPGNGQSVEYAISTESDGTGLGRYRTIKRNRPHTSR